MGLDGYNASVFILDEFHAARNYDLYNVLVSSQGSRQQPLGIIITTAGFLLDGYPCYETRKTCIDILKGTLEDPTQFSAIYELDKDDDWKNPDVWIKATPSLGQTVSYEYLKEQVTNAKNNPALEVGIRTKNFNSFLQSRNIWIPENLVTDCFDKINISDFTDQEAWMGVDLSAVSDLTAFSVMFTPDPDRKVHPDKFVFKSWIYVPEQTITDSLNCELYKFWKRQGYIIQTSGNVVDYDYILRDQLQVYGTCYLNGIGYDSWNATQWAIDATNEGLPLYPFSQTVGNFNKPTKLFEIL
jgi:phage terminase large subunit-like protein